MTLHDFIIAASTDNTAKVAADKAKTDAATALNAATDADAAAIAKAADSLAKLAAVLPVETAYAISNEEIVLNIAGTPTFLTVVDPATVTLPDPPTA